jgi:hypothetical protein
MKALGIFWFIMGLSMMTNKQPAGIIFLVLGIYFMSRDDSSSRNRRR